MELNNAARAAVHQILKHAAHFEWSLQGLGMLRLYLSKEVRLHVWDSRFVVADASVIHTHPWDFESYVVSGEVRQFRYWEEPRAKPGTARYKRQLIQCGPDGCAVNEPAVVDLQRGDLQIFGAGMSYRQDAADIHESLPTPGTVAMSARCPALIGPLRCVYVEGHASRWTAFRRLFALKGQPHVRMLPTVHLTRAGMTFASGPYRVVQELPR